ncbi:substrate-binding domain-containing protein [Prosthecobacter sp.]|uniref:substrate-binding domain-containing protein n=1 Tax=Prosthecobacter sp. TaxID=1965333 RepID=UPI003784E60A
MDIPAPAATSAGMHPLPRRESLIHQVATILRKSIRDGVWAEFLPGELSLCESFQVSRETLRGALGILGQEKLISSSQGQRRRILTPATQNKTPRRRGVILLTSVRLEQMDGASILLIDGLRGQLAKHHLELQVQVSPACFTRKPEKALAAMVQGSTMALWVLFSAPAAAQRWFMKQGLPCVLVGSLHPGIALPSLDADYDAMGQHAANQLLSRGHRRLAVVIPKSVRAGDAYTVAAFRAACAKAPGATLQLLEHDGTPAGIQRCINSMLKESPATGLFIAHARHVLTVMSSLTSRGLRIPADVSVISRDSESFLEFMVPRPTHYHIPPLVLAQKLSQVVLKMARGESVVAKSHLIMPTLVAGETLAKR